jgi:hypothetical protein
MPFISKKQMKLCYILQKKGKNKNWDCKEWSQQTDYSSLPEYAPTSLISKKSKTKSKSKSRSKKRSNKRSRSKK